MSRRRAAPVVPLPTRPPMPIELQVFNPCEWGASDDDAARGDAEAGYRAAVAAWDESRADWCGRYAHLPAGDPPGDEPWCGEFAEHDCVGVDCPRRPIGRDVCIAGLGTRHEAALTFEREDV